MDKIPSIRTQLNDRPDLRFFKPELGKSLRTTDVKTLHMVVRQLDLSTGDVVLAHRNPLKEKIIELVNHADVYLYTFSVAGQWIENKLVSRVPVAINRYTPHAVYCIKDTGHQIKAHLRIILENEENDAQWEEGHENYPDIPRS